MPEPNWTGSEGPYVIEYITTYQSTDRWQTSQWVANLDYLKEHFEQTYINRNNRDFVIRVRDTATDHVVYQLPAKGYPFANDEVYEAIDWNENALTSRQLAGELVHMIQVGIRRIDGKLTLLVNAREFHDELDKIGVTHTNNKYNDRPASAAQVATNNFILSPEVLLTRDYKEVEYTDTEIKDGVSVVVVKKIPVTGCFTLAGIWTNPPSFENLKKLCNSAHEVARKVLEHYQPIDISVEIHKKIVK